MTGLPLFGTAYVSPNGLLKGLPVRLVMSEPLEENTGLSFAAKAAAKIVSSEVSATAAQPKSVVGSAAISVGVEPGLGCRATIV